MGGYGVTRREETTAVFYKREVWMERERRLLWEARYQQRRRGAVRTDVERADCLRGQKERVRKE